MVDTDTLLEASAARGFHLARSAMDVNPKQTEQGHVPGVFSASERRSIGSRLAAPIPLVETSTRVGPNGVRIHYLEGWKVINEANSVFRFDGWSLHVVTVEVREKTEIAPGRYSASVSAQVRVTLSDGSYREDRGGGYADKMRSSGEAILKAEKEAVTDATKRALKNFGSRLGLCLYNRAYTRGDSGDSRRGVGAGY